MRSLFCCVALGVVSLGLVGLLPADGQGYPYPSGGVSYGSPVMAPSYYAPPVVRYYPAPAFSCYPRAPTYSYGPPRVAVSRGPAAELAPPGRQVEVGAYDNCFEPRTITVPPGTTVRWVNRGKHGHTVTSTAGLFDSGDIPPGGSYTTTLRRPGVYPYYCRYHTRERMAGTIVVSTSAGGSSGGAYGDSGSSGY